MDLQNEVTAELYRDGNIMNETLKTVQDAVSRAERQYQLYEQSAMSKRLMHNYFKETVT